MNGKYRKNRDIIHWQNITEFLCRWRWICMNINVPIKEQSKAGKYGFESWILYRGPSNKWRNFTCMLSLFPPWQSFNIKILNHVKFTSTDYRIIRAQMRWVWHVLRMNNCCRLLYHVLESGQKSQGWPHKHYKNIVKGHCDIQLREQEAVAADRSHWQTLIYEAFNTLIFTIPDFSEQHQRYHISQVSKMKQSIFSAHKWAFYSTHFMAAWWIGWRHKILQA